MAELKFLNIETCKVLRYKEPTICVSGKPGKISINKEAAAKLGLTEKDTFQVVLDGKWCYVLLNFTGGFPLRIDKGSLAGNFAIQNAGLARGIMKNCGFEEKSSYRFRLGDKIDLKGHEVFELKKQSVLD